jgi:hypothetical protein
MNGSLKKTFFALGLIFPLIICPQGPDARKIGLKDPVTYRVKNGPGQRVLGVQDGVLSYTSITSSSPGEVRPLMGEEFIIHLKERKLSASDFKVINAEQSGPGGLDLRLTADDPPLTVLLRFRQEPGSSVIRKWLEIRPAAESVFIDRITLESFEAWAEPETFPGDGQPVYVGDTFFSVAYPSSQNAASGMKVTCGYPVGLRVGEEGYVSRESVFGVSGKGKIREVFFDYIDRVRARPVRPFILYNSWYDIFNFTDQEVIQSIEGFRKHLTEPYGIELDSVVLDDGWDDFSRLWRPHKKRFPHGFGPVREAAEAAGSHMGLWMSPIGGYANNHNRRILGTLDKGYEKNVVGFCFAGDAYNRAFTGRMVEYVKECGVNYYKLDNLNTTCKNPRHGHRVGKYDQAGLTDAFIETLKKTREADPEVMINFTVGSWLSPWWLMYADVLWRGGMDYGFAGPGSRRQQNITYVDKVLYKRLRAEKSQFPLSSLMTHGIIKGRRQSFGEHGENLRDFADDVWMYLGRGVMMWELYLSPDMLSEREWKTLADAILFAREHADLLARSEMVLGGPEAGQVYGFYHQRGDERLVALRNPLDREQGLPPEAADRYLPRVETSSGGCRVVYSSMDKAADSPLTPFEVRVIFCRSGEAGGD